MKPLLNLIMLFVGLMFSIIAYAQETTASPEKKEAYYFAIKGGVSLGSYETGLNRTLLRYVQDKGDNLISFSGASAGSINSVLSAIDACIIDKRISLDDIALHDSVNQNFMRWAWDIGIEDLVPSEENQSKDGDATQRSIFSRQGFDKKKEIIKQLISRNAKKDCNIIITMSITKVEPFQFDINEIGETVKLQRFVIPIQVYESAGKLQFKNYEAIYQQPDNRSINFPSPYLKLVENHLGLVDFDDIWDLGLASSAFPLAFSPVALSYCYPHQMVDGEKCTDGRARTELFSDGGFFDNSPIGVSLDVYDVFKSNNPQQDDSIKLIYINPDSYRVREKNNQKKVEDHSVSGLYDYGSYFVNSLSNALDQEYRSALERLSGIESENRNFYMTNRFHHLLADLHSHFGAFYAAEYRMHDYLVGVYDGEQLLAQIKCDIGNTGLSNKGVNRFDTSYQECVREEVLQWINTQGVFDCSSETEQGLSHESVSLQFFRYLYNSEYDKSLSICNEPHNIYIALSKSFGTVNTTRSTQVHYSDYLDRLDIHAKDLDIAEGSDLARILLEGRQFSAEKLSAIYENIIEMQTAAATCQSCPEKLGNQYIGTALKVAEPIADSFISHYDSGIWPLPLFDVLAVNYGFNANQKNQVLSIDYRPQFLTFDKFGIDLSLGYHDFGQELADDDYWSFALGLTHHNSTNGFLLSTWTVGYQYETEGDHVYDSEVDSLYLKGGFLNELVSLKFLYRLDDIESFPVNTRDDQAIVLTIDVSKVCQMVLPHWCGR